MTLPRGVRAALVVGALALALVPLSGDRFWVQFAAKVMIGCLFAVSLDLLVGYAGLVSLAHSAFFGLSAYLLAGLSNKLGLASAIATLPLCIAFAAVAALAVGWLTLRTSGVYFVMVTLAFTQMLYYLFSESAALGGSDGVYIAQRPRVVVAGHTLFDFGDRVVAYAAIWVALVLGFIVLRAIVQAPFGRVLSAIRINEPRMRTLGYRTRLYKLAAFVLGGALAGLAGYLDATLYGFVNPAQFGWRQSGLVLVTVLLGGKGTLYGPALGAALLSVLEHFAERATEHWNAVVGAAVIAVVLFLPRGVAGLLEGERRG
jgi:branched-chain amino acid transport system permease protein